MNKGLIFHSPVLDIILIAFSDFSITNLIAPDNIVKPYLA